jgi:hypothetical protein
MIPKILCWLFGHTYFDLVFAGTVKVWSQSVKRHVWKALMRRVERTHCSRCCERNPGWDGTRAARTEQLKPFRRTG